MRTATVTKRRGVYARELSYDLDISSVTISSKVELEIHVTVFISLLRALSYIHLLSLLPLLTLVHKMISK